MKSCLGRLLLIASTLLAAPLPAAELNTARIDELTGLKGKLNEAEGVYCATFPRADVPVTVEGWKMPPFMGLGTWAAFTKAEHAEAMLMADDAIRESRIASSSESEFPTVRGVRPWWRRRPAISDGASSHLHGLKVWLGKLAPHVPTKALYVTHV